MTHTALLERLFNAHLADLKSVVPEFGDAIVCPMCLDRFLVDAIYTGELTDGHVWPDYIRKKPGSPLAASQRVLLCEACNSRAGSRGDRQMQLRERVREGEKTGQLYGERRIEIIRRLGQKPIDLRAEISKTGELKFRLRFTNDEGRQVWARNSPQERERFLSLAAQDEPFSVIVYPPKGVDSKLARVGWLTSAYLLAFYTFGYRYIFHESLDPVRKHILASFGDDAMEKLAFPKSDVVGVMACESHHYNHPRIELDLPVNGKSPVHLEVSFLDCHVKLPFHGVPEVLSEVLLSKNPALEKGLSELAKQQDASLRVPISCTKDDGHTCVWDYIMGMPIPKS